MHARKTKRSFMTFRLRPLCFESINLDSVLPLGDRYIWKSLHSSNQSTQSCCFQQYVPVIIRAPVEESCDNACFVSVKIFTWKPVHSSQTCSRSIAWQWQHVCSFFCSENDVLKDQVSIECAFWLVDDASGCIKDNSAVSLHSTRQQSTSFSSDLCLLSHAKVWRNVMST